MSFSRLTALLFGLSLAGSAFALTPPLSSIDAYKVITIEGEDMPVALGQNIDDLSLAAIQDNVMEPVPFQIDQYNTGGAIYFDGWEVPMAGDAKKMDPTDKLLFLFKDAGVRRKSTDPYDGEVLAEIKLKDTAGIERFVYLVRGSRLRSEEQYVRYSAEMGVVETDFYSLRYNKDNHLKWDDFQYLNYVGERPLDSMKLRLKTGLVSSIAPTELNNDDLVALPTGEKIGPIRTTTQLDFTLYLVKLPILQLSLQIHHYPKAVMYDVRGIIPEVRRYLLKDPSIAMTLDANRLLGSTIRMANGPKEPGVVDGKIDALETQMRQVHFTPQQNWYWVSTKRNLDIVAYLDYLGDFNEPISPVIDDDLTREDPPEVFPGQLPNVGYRIDSFPMKGFLGFVVSIYVSDGLEGDPEVFTQQLRTIPELQVRPL
ncbi:MAG: hypothetical protein HPY82_22855 [Gammaproteobacteria bacterium]|nr:hypothetical protein [Gammaproteobacteria bacterium]